MKSMGGSNKEGTTESVWMVLYCLNGVLPLLPINPMPPKLVATTSEDQIRLTIVANYEQWGSRTLTLEQYMEREFTLRTTEFSKSLSTWILIDESAPLDILSACETYERPSMARVRGQVVHGTCYAIASVYTPPHHRKKGYAGLMLEMLLKELNQRPNSLGSTLYSDIGPDFYSKKGWKVYPSISLYLDLDSSNGFTTPKEVSLMTLAQARPLLEIDAIKMQHDFANSDQNAFMIVPTFDAQEWHYRRAMFYTKALAVDTKVKNVGARFNGNSDYITWSHDIEDSTLYITHLKANSKQSFQALLSAALAEASHCKFKIFELWDPSKEFLEWGTEIVPSIKAIQRTKNLSSLAFWGFTLEENDELVWKYNEQHCWV
jgi:GNAT superfamily N-acetyltransferase